MARYKSFAEFYPYYLSEHAKPMTRRCHFIGCILAIGCLVGLVFSRDWRFILLGFFLGYLFAWIGHFFFEKNRPATFQYPVYSFLGDWVMFKDILTGKVEM